MWIADEKDKNNNVIEEILKTTVRGQTIKITAEDLNTMLGVVDVPTQDPQKLFDQEIFRVLRLEVQMGPLKIKPADMNDKFCVFWYIYSQNLVQKG